MMILSIYCNYMLIVEKEMVSIMIYGYFVILKLVYFLFNFCYVIFVYLFVFVINIYLILGRFEFF